MQYSHGGVILENNEGLAGNHFLKVYGLGLGDLYQIAVKMKVLWLIARPQSLSHNYGRQVLRSLTEMAQIAAASVPPKRGLTRNGSCAWLLGLEQWKERKGPVVCGEVGLSQGGFMQSSLGGVLPPQRN